jgi:hypothetical protein
MKNNFFLVTITFLTFKLSAIDLICNAPEPKSELISSTKSRFINSDEYYTRESYSYRANDKEKYKKKEAVTKNLKFCSSPKNSFFIKKANNGYFVESRCSKGITKFSEINFNDDLIFSRFEWFYESDDLRALDWDSNNIYLMEDKSFYQVKFQQLNSTMVVEYPLLILNPKSYNLEIRDLPEKEDSLRYSTTCTSKD